MKKLYFLLLIFSLGTQGQGINFPDANFKAKLLEANASNEIAKNLAGVFFKIDSNDDGEIQVTEALEVSNLNIEQANITNLSGISNFSNVTSLTIIDNQFTEIPGLNILTNLTSLTISSNLFFSEIDLSPLINLEKFENDGTALTTLDINGLENLQSINCNNLQLLTSFKASGLNLQSLTLFNALELNHFEVTNCTVDNLMACISCSQNLETFNISGSLLPDNFEYNTEPGHIQVKHLDISNSTGITSLFRFNTEILESLDIRYSNIRDLTVSNSVLTNIDFTGTRNLNTLYLENNPMPSLDLSETALTAFGCSNMPTSFINIKNGINTELYLNNMHLLEYVCVDESEIAMITGSVEGNTTVGSYCDFVPGGTFNTVTGKTRFDIDANGCETTGAALPFIKIKLTSDTTEWETFTSQTGNYHFYTGQGQYNIIPNFENPQYFNASPQTALVNFPSLDGLVYVQDFCITANGIHPDVEIVIAPLDNARPGFDTHYKIVYKNKGNQTLSGNIAFNYDEALLDYVSANQTPAAQISGRLTFDYLNLLPFENREIIAVLNLNSPVEQPPVNIDDELVFTAEINPVAADASPDDNYFTFRQTAIGSYDPNDKTCLEGNVVSTDNIGKYLHYNINFENTGNADAVNVVIRDTINMGKFDLGSLQVLNSSHPVVVNIKANIVEFIFENINLPPSIMNPIGGHGNVLFKIKTKGNLYPGDTVENTANIYFDYNAPIVTNEAKTTFAVLNAEQFNRDTSIKLEPNPTRDFIKIRSKNTLQSVQLFDVNGRILQTAIENKKETTIDLSAVTKGIYFVKINSDKGSKIEKLIKE